MSKVFVTADTHFGHTGILRTPGRKGLFQSIYEHDQTLVDNWNSVVSKRDVVYHLGDVGMCRREYLDQILPELNGAKKYLVAGNHDEPSINKHFDKVYGAKVHKNCLLTHVPIHPQEMYWDINIHGHLHDNKVWCGANDPGMGVMGNVRDPRYLCVSCEQTGFRPVELVNVIAAHLAVFGEAINNYNRKGFRRQ